ncbi:bifunctional glutamate N-acetyltransferase/amino-acid acetyltransferase ArgJ [Candidatus Mesenet endosymbiont of Agriotes lineatus]|uniref:bifunctional glutamate N-acetyltransferase/amino-acid acetyltransferase ArgJ n=1 Tax=Candidatus Mesenet endosymbiont of Agriotes lineatus TaxID=3077948 RepID=UPI0030CF75D8
MKIPKSPFYPQNFPEMPEIKGVKMAVEKAGIRNSGKNDILVMEFTQDTSVAGVFTTSYAASSNIEHCRKILPFGKARVLIVNSGNANVANGSAGYKAVEEIVNLCTGLFQCKREEVYFSSTGVIGRPLPVDKMKAAVKRAAKELSANSWKGAAISIMTTDTYHKMVTRETDIGGTKITINGICKGSGMIAPNMATMLSYVITDANISTEVLQKILDEYVPISFNSITVEGDTSTSDTLLVFATGYAGNEKVDSFDDPKFSSFKLTLKEMLIEMAHLIVKDGEGASKFITIIAKGTSSVPSAKQLALSVANSPLVKTAIAGGDANWGRIVMALGKAGIKFDKNKIAIKIGNVQVVENGELSVKYNEHLIMEYMKGSNIEIEIDLSQGQSKATVWTCDLTHGFITINSKYLT